MSRQVLTLPDLPATFLTESEGDARYAPAGHTHDASYAPVVHNHDATYVNTAGDTMTGNLIVQPAGQVATRITPGYFGFRSDGAANDRFGISSANGGEINFGDNATGFDLTIGRDLAGVGYIDGDWRVYGGTLRLGTDATLTRTGAGALRVDTNLGVGVAPRAWGAAIRALDLGPTLAFYSDAATPSLNLGNNVGPGGTAITSTAASLYQQYNGNHVWLTTAGGTAGQPLSFATRMGLNQTGTLTLTPDAGQLGIHVSGTTEAIRAYSQPATTGQAYFGSWGETNHQNGYYFGYSNGSFNINRRVSGVDKGPSISIAGNGMVSLSADAGAIGLLMYAPLRIGSGHPILLQESTNNNYMGFYMTGNLLQGYYNGSPISWRFDSGSNTVTASISPHTDNLAYCGTGGARWVAVYAVNPAIQTSHVSLKEGFTRLDGRACAEAVLGTDWLAFDYKPPVPPERPEGLADEAWTMQVAEHERQVADTAVGRKQKGYVLGSEEYKTAALFGQDDRYSASTSADLAVVACALQHALQEIAMIKGRLDL